MAGNKPHILGPGTCLRLAKLCRTAWQSARNFPLPYRLRSVRCHTLTKQQNLFGWRSMEPPKKKTRCDERHESVSMELSKTKMQAISEKNNNNSPKHMPHKPVNIVSKITSQISPFNVKPKIEKLNSSTNVVCPHIIMNWVVTCDSKISMPVIPDTRHRSSIPSFRSISIAPDVSATDKKKMIVSITPGAAKSVKFGVCVP